MGNKHSMSCPNEFGFDTPEFPWFRRHKHEKIADHPPPKKEKKKKKSDEDLTLTGAAPPSSGMVEAHAAAIEQPIPEEPAIAIDPEMEAAILAGVRPGDDPGSVYVPEGAPLQVEVTDMIDDFSASTGNKTTNNVNMTGGSVVPTIYDHGEIPPPIISPEEMSHTQALAAKEDKPTHYLAGDQQDTAGREAPLEPEENSEGTPYGSPLLQELVLPDQQETAGAEVPLESDENAAGTPYGSPPLEYDGDYQYENDEVPYGYGGEQDDYEGEQYDGEPYPYDEEYTDEYAHDDDYGDYDENQAYDDNYGYAEDETQVQKQGDN